MLARISEIEDGRRLNGPISSSLLHSFILCKDFLLVLWQRRPKLYNRINHHIKMKGGSLVHTGNMQARQALDRSHDKSDRGRILPSSSENVQAAIAAIQTRSAALRRQTAQSMSSLHHHDHRSDGSAMRSSRDRRQSLGSNSSIDSDESSNGGGQQAFFSDIEAVIDHVNGKKQERQQLVDDTGKDADIQIAPSSDSDISSDDSLIAEGMVSNATQMNISAFIDSLNDSANNPSNSKEKAANNSNPPVRATAEDEAQGDGKEDNPDTEDVDKYTFPDEDEEEVQYNEGLLNSHIDKAIEFADKEWPEASSLEYIIFYARRDKVPIIPVLDAFDEKMKKRKDITAKKDIPAQRLSRLIREAVKLVETKNITAQNYSSMIDAAEAEKFEISMFKAILRNPKKHVKYVKHREEALTNDFEKLSVNNDIAEKEEEDKPVHSSKKKENQPISMNTNQPRLEKREEKGVTKRRMSRSLSDEEEPRVDTNRVYFESKMDQLYNADRRACREEFSRLPDVGGVQATKKVLTTRIFKRHPSITPFRVTNWKLPDEDRSRLHEGYKGVLSESIELAVQADQRRTEEEFEWEKLGTEMTTTTSLMETADFFGTLSKHYTQNASVTLFLLHLFLF